MTSIHWDASHGLWAATLEDGTVIRSPSETELESFLDLFNQSPARRRRERLCNAVAVVTVTAILCIVTAVAAWLW